MKKIILPVFFVLASLAGIAQAGTLDPRFGGRGFVRTAYGPADWTPPNDVSQVLPDNDGSFYLVFEMNLQTIVARFLSNTVLDTTFGEKGYSEPVPMLFPKALLQPDGKIVLGGSSYYLLESEDFKLARLNTNGFLDSSFGKNGKVKTNFSTADELTGLALQNDGCIVAVGNAYTPSGVQLALARYNPDGSADSSFSGDGRLNAFFNGISYFGHAVAVQADGKIVAAGQTQNRLAITRFKPDGSPDSTFNGTGGQKISIGVDAWTRAMTIQPDGKIVVAGGSYDATSVSSFTVVRLNTDGTPDNSFSGDGIQTTNTGSSGAAKSVALQSDGKIVLAGNATGIVVIRYNADGTLDNSFSGDGYTSMEITSVGEIANSVVILADGKILIGGSAYVDTGNPSGIETYYLAIRLNADGSPDNGFDGDGILTGLRPVAGLTIYEAVAVQPDGKVVAGGNLEDGKLLVSRFSSNGAMDSSFSGDGIQAIGLPTQARCRGVVIQQDGKIVVAVPNFLIRLNPDGSPDSSFSGDGIVPTGTITGGSQQSLALQPDGKIVVAGSAYVVGINSRVFFFARFTTDGEPDNDFSEDGKTILDVSSKDDEIISVLVRPDGKIAAIGNAGQNMTGIAVAQLNEDGTPDQLFGYNGSIIHYLGGDVSDASAAVLQDNGKIVIAGHRTIGLGSDFLLMRINADGTKDPGFSGDGMQFLHPGSSQAYARAVVVQPDGKIIAGGMSSGTGGPDYTLLRVTPDGNPDYSFSPDGFVTSNFGHYNEIRALALHGNRVYAAGFTHYGNRMGLVAAYLLDKIAVPPLVTIRDTTAMPRHADTNTVYPGYAPAASITLTAEATAGTPPYSYLWSNGATTSAITVSPTVNTIYTVTVTDAAGETATAGKEVMVEDVRCGYKMDKVLIFQQRSGNRRDCHTLCVAPQAVSLFLRNGWKLGHCDAPTIPDRLKLTVYPNPSYHTFTVNITSNKPDYVEIMVRDICGRIIEKRTLPPNTNFQIGGSYRPGIYLIEARQGYNKETVKIIKLPGW